MKNVKSCHLNIYFFNIFHTYNTQKIDTNYILSTLRLLISSPLCESIHYSILLAVYRMRKEFLKIAIFIAITPYVLNQLITSS